MVSSMVEAREGVVGWLVSRYFSGRRGGGVHKDGRCGEEE